MAELDCRGVEERLPWFLHGSLPPEELREVQAHLETCGGCRAALAATRRASALFGAHPEAGTLVDYAFGLALEEQSRAALELHLAHCLECQDELRLVEAERESAAAGVAPAAASPPPASALSARPPRMRALALAATVAVASGLAVYVAMRERSGLSGGTAGRVALVELLPDESRTRGGEEAEIAISAAVNQTLLLVTDRAETFDEVRVRILPRDGGRALREESGLLPALGGGYALLLPAGTTPAGSFEIELEGRLQDEWQPLGRYRLRITP